MVGISHGVQARIVIALSISKNHQSDVLHRVPELDSLHFLARRHPLERRLSIQPAYLAASADYDCVVSCRAVRLSSLFPTAGLNLATRSLHGQSSNPRPSKPTPFNLTDAHALRQLLVAGWLRKRPSSRSVDDFAICLNAPPRGQDVTSTLGPSRTEIQSPRR